MRVLYFTTQDSPHDQRFLTALARTPHQVFSLRMHTCDPDTPAGITELAWRDDQPDWSGWAGWQVGIAKLREILSDLKPDLIHAGPIQGPALAAALTGFKPLVTMSWGFDLLRTARRSPWMGEATQCALDRSAVLVADCQTVADQAAGYGFPRERMVLFPWGVDLDHFSPKHAMESGQQLTWALGWEGRFVLFCNRSWSVPYGVDDLAQAFVIAHQQRPDLRLLLAGDGPQSGRIRHILAPVADAVHFPGWVAREDLPAYYGAGDLFVSPSHCDGSSVSLLEALACGRPVLVSDIPSNQEWVRPGDVGDLVSDGDVRSLAGQLLALSADPDLATYGTRARLLAEERADWTVNFNKLLAAYQMAMT
jgi:glycosyltransferase involved in cell wall biosynthesis